MEINLSIRGQELRLLGRQPNLYHGSVGVLYIKFCDVNFDKSLIKTVRFKTAESDWYTQDIIDGRVRVPHEVIKVGGFDVAVGGYDTENGELVRFLPTNSVHIDIEENGYGEADAPLMLEGDSESVIGRLEKKADIEYVNELIPKRTAIGTTIELSDHIGNKSVVNCKIQGNSVQETRSGQNLFPAFVKNIDYGNGNIVKVSNEGVIEIVKKADTLININTTIELEAGVYTLYSGLEQGNDEIYIQLDCGTNDTFLCATTIEPIKQITHGGGKVRIVVFASTSAKTDGIKIYPQLLAGAFVKENLPEYEPFGKMPSEEFPSEIKSVGEYLEKDKYKIPVIVKNAKDDIQNEFPIYVKEPLRRLNNQYDYIDYLNQCVVRNIEVLDSSGTISLNESLAVLEEPIYEKIEFPQIVLPENDTVNVSVDTAVPADIELTYYQDINKVIAELKSVQSA